MHVTPRTQALTHLFFADDIILFSKVKEEVYELIQILNTFSTASGQRVNIQKLGLIFGKKFPATMRSQISNILGIQS